MVLSQSRSYRVRVHAQLHQLRCFNAWAITEIHDLKEKICTQKDQLRESSQVQTLQDSYSWLKQTVPRMDKKVSELWEAAEGPSSDTDEAFDIQVKETILNTTNNRKASL